MVRTMYRESQTSRTKVSWELQNSMGWERMKRGLSWARPLLWSADRLAVWAASGSWTVRRGMREQETRGRDEGA
ncbi:hypothetical protein GQ607_006575 [Colletotrichum asianum]|uniref:Uncharacterized protein n=1 Tax=Colletotrichum asianum TaxID=702518 RepID=A0A8H3WHT2_9PEZI|nr:hypothetical protein GQ607_006575 [Colletotrichum asianum]